jgi:lipid-A-disaccharide synthase
MVIAGEASGDALAAELVQALRLESSLAPAVLTSEAQPLRTSLEPRFFGAGGTHMAAAGVELALDLTRHSVTGLSDVLKNYGKFRKLFHRLLDLARERQPEAIICVDFSGFNRRWGHAVKRYARAHQDWFHNWEPKLIQYVSPQVWASRAKRADLMARDFDLVLSLFPFEKPWYAQRVPKLPVEFVGHPMVDRYGPLAPPSRSGSVADAPHALLLPGSRADELRRHLPIMFAALRLVRQALPGLKARIVLPNQDLLDQTLQSQMPGGLEAQVGGLAQALAEADIAIASTGTVTLECAYFGVPTVALYRTSWLTYHIARQIVKVQFLAMPNLLANEALFPEFIQAAATGENIAGAVLELLRSEPKRLNVRQRLAEVVATLGGPGASRRAARCILRLLES